ncbi:hypothetical protein Pdw03_6209 [Penicillium digitatum]|uniref:Uncharacterized protein n=3 Tax=Penicillium digitatum TaxID=36651 RepID=K9GA46_PEND2|nr:hypothetical protein PDIP_38990 [Penicillium digitatum Pd1]EKV15824.1 hypothetical protein PDIP_38990 [Penicillium digitatum Pd1]EKV17889.1 hypothetical protein PDIG_12770 [Penicillium digitatum PHI26]QQK42308.1 hypothetical protein Pdw03_6209 [Penicillium digitatum]
MASNQPTLLEYARFYNIAADSTRYCPISFADDTCEPTTPIPPVDGLRPENPEERLKEIDQRFCTELMMEKLPTKPEDIELLSGCLQLESDQGNLWRGILPEVTTTDVKGEPLLLTTEDERMVTSSEFQATFAQSPAPSSATPSVRLVVPSGPDVPVVPMNTRDVFDHYNSGISQSNCEEGFAAPGNAAAKSSNAFTTSHLAGDVLPPIVGPSGTVQQFVSIESDPVPSIQDYENEGYATSVLSSEDPTESEFSAFVFDNNVPTPSFDVSPYEHTQPVPTLGSPNLTKEKGISVDRNDCQKAQAPRSLKETKTSKALIEPAADTRISRGKKRIVTFSFSTLHEDAFFVSKSCSSSSVIQPANDQNSTQLARDSQNANDDHVSIKTPYEKTINTTTTHTSSFIDNRYTCLAQEELFCVKLGYQSHPTGLKKHPLKLSHAVSSVDYTETSRSSTTVLGGLGSLSLFMKTRGSDRGHVTSSQDASFPSLSTCTSSGQGEFSHVSSLVGDRSPDPDETLGPSRSPSPAFELQEVVTQSAFYPPPIFFLSTTLLTTHPSVVQDMEGWPENPPKLIYRDYGDVFSDSQYHYEAEIILAPDAGLILTTPYELTQRYLPGHGPRDERFSGIQGLESPLREKIMCLMHRYALLVVLICKPYRADASRVQNSSLTREITSLAQFCNTEGLSTTLLIPIPNHSASIVLWCFGMGRLRCELHPPEMIANITEEESEYEVALRDLGVNPFAARLILDNIRVGGFNQDPGFDMNPTALASHEIVANPSTDSRAFDVFMNMDSFERNMKYGSVIGEDVISRVSEVIELTSYTIPDGNETDSEDVFSTQISLD